jgi:LEA14-like dessication related protein
MMAESPIMRPIPMLAVVALFTGCSSVTKPWITPGITLVDIRPALISAEQQTFVLSLNVNNPNARTLPIKGVTYNLLLEGHEIANGGGRLNEQIPPFDEGIVDVEVSTSLMDLFGTVSSLALSGGKWNYEISGVLEVAGGYLPVPFRYRGEIEATQIISRLMR